MCTENGTAWMERKGIFADVDYLTTFNLIEINIIIKLYGLRPLQWRY